MILKKLPTLLDRRLQNEDFVIYPGDCLNLLEALPDCSVDLIISSPPYFIGKEYDTSSAAEDFILLHDRITPHLTRILKPGGSLCWQVGYHVSDRKVVPLDFLAYQAFSQQSDLQLRNRIVWTFSHGAHCSRRFSGRHEVVLWFSKGDIYHFDLDSVRVPQKYPGKKHYKGPKRGQWSGNPKGKNPGDVWDIPNVKANHVEKTAHPCQFPVALAQRLVLGLSPPDGLVVDPFAGVCSTGVAALSKGRRFIGAEISLEYATIGNQRVKDFRNGTLSVRDLLDPIFTPRSTSAVAQVPPHFESASDGVEVST